MRVLPICCSLHYYETLLSHSTVDRSKTGGMMLEAGQVLHDNDPRYRGRRVELIRVEGSFAICRCGPREVKVRLDRIFSDGQSRRSGYSTGLQDDSVTGST
jgi:hypothetical protein